ncbi:MAG: hypothetical protein HQK55_00785 [Deltaproteobacteria bacterium]|nr:hypothetical protein [Deltaproteobacteria bacterium]
MKKVNLWPCFSFMTTTYVTLCLLLAGLGISFPTMARAQGASGGINYAIYNNPRFVYSIAYPEEILIPQGEADNGDGQKFLSKDGKVVMLVYGQFNVFNQTLKDAFSKALKEETPGGKVTYKVLKGNWFVVSGKVSNRVFYQKTMLADDTFKTFRIEYPEDQKGVFDKITEEIVKSFKG